MYMSRGIQTPQSLMIAGDFNIPMYTDICVIRMCEVITRYNLTQYVMLWLPITDLLQITETYLRLQCYENCLCITENSISDYRQLYTPKYC